MSKLRIFVDFALSPDVLELLREGTRGHELVFPLKPITSVLAKADPDPQFGAVDVAFGQPDPGAVATAERLKWVHISTSGIARYDNPEFRALVAGKKIPVSNSASVYNEACAVHTLSFILAQARQLPLSLQTNTANGTEAWNALRQASTTLRDETVLILGYGAIGKRLAELLIPLGMKVLAYRRKPRGDEGVPVVTEAQLTQALGEADHVVDILPDSADTRGFFSGERFAMFKSGAAFYNIGRGTTVDQDALLASLQSGQLRAAWLDVTDPEPLPGNHPLWAEPACHITPHVAGGHADETKTLVRHFLRNLERYVRQQPLLDRVM